jgi:acyl carrier protein
MLEKMKQYISEQLNIDADEITAESDFKDDLGADSLDLYELVMNLEDEYDIEIPVEELQNMAKVGDVIEYLSAHGIEE